MAEYNTTVTLGGYTLYITSISPTKVPSTLKQSIGRKLIKHQVVGRQIFDWRLNISGFILSGTTDSVTRAQQRANLESMDDVNVYAYVDGIHDGNYIIEPGTLSFSDSSGEEFAIYNYSFTLIQYNQ